MKKLSILALMMLLVAMLAFTLTACDDNGTGDNPPDNPPVEGPCAEGHEWAVDKKKDATCYKEGSATYECEVCGEKKTETLPLLAHKLQKISAVSPTCTEPGKTAGERCRVPGCGYRTGGEDIPMLNHSPVITPATEPTCVSKGYTEGIHCSVCLDNLLPSEIDAEKYPELAAMKPCEEIPALDHLEVEAGYIAPTCASEGSEGGTVCSRCGHVMTAPTKIYDKLTTHAEYVVISVADCTNDGYSRCVLCGDEQISSYKDPDKHVWVIDEEGIAPDCTTKTNGKTASYKCGVAGCDTIITSTDISWELLHDESSEYCSIVWDENNSFAATTEHAGEKYGECSGCGFKLRIDIPMIDDNKDFNEDNNIYPEDVIGTPPTVEGDDEDDEESGEVTE